MSNFSMDTKTIRPLFSRPNKPHIFAPLNNDSYFASLGIPTTHFHCLDWWESRDIDVSLPCSGPDSAEIVQASVKLTCTPCQHLSSRTPWDLCHTLWSSWAVEDTSSSATAKSKVWFGGDTAYRTVKKGENPADQPVCPAFKEIGDKFGQFDLALIPIG